MFDWFKKDTKLDEAAKKIELLEVQLEQAKQEESERVQQLNKKGKAQAIAHLRAAERYYEQMIQTKGARKTELKAIIDLRLERAEQLGYAVRGTITETINRLV